MDVWPNGCQLGISRSEVSIRWIGVPGLLWSTVVPEVPKVSHWDKAPDVLVIQ